MKKFFSLLIITLMVWPLFGQEKNIAKPWWLNEILDYDKVALASINTAVPSDDLESSYSINLYDIGSISYKTSDPKLLDGCKFWDVREVQLSENGELMKFSKKYDTFKAVKIDDYARNEKLAAYFIEYRVLDEIRKGILFSSTPPSNVTLWFFIDYDEAVKASDKYQTDYANLMDLKISLAEFNKMYNVYAGGVNHGVKMASYQKNAFVKAKEMISAREAKKADEEFHIIYKRDGKKTTMFTHNSQFCEYFLDSNNTSPETGLTYPNGCPKHIINFAPDHRFTKKKCDIYSYDFLKMRFEPAIMINLKDTLYEVDRRINYYPETPWSKNEFLESGFVNQYYGEYDGSKFKGPVKLTRLREWNSKFIKTKNGLIFTCINKTTNGGRIDKKTGEIIKSTGVEYNLNYSFNLNELYKEYLENYNASKGRQSAYRAEKAQADASQATARQAKKEELYSIYGKKYVNSAYDFEFMVGMHEDLANVIVKQLWVVTKSTELRKGKKIYYLSPNSSVGSKRVLLTLVNKKIIRISTW